MSDQIAKTIETKRNKFDPLNISPCVQDFGIYLLTGTDWFENIIRLQIIKLIKRSICSSCCYYHQSQSAIKSKSNLCGNNVAGTALRVDFDG